MSSLQPSNRLKPSSPAFVDAGAVLLLGLLALLGFRHTYAGWSYLILGGAGLVIGLAIAAGLHAQRQPVIVIAAATMVAFIVFGELLALPGHSPVALATIHTLTLSAVLGWKELLTTAPPVDAGDPLVIVPFILGLLGGVAGYLLAQAIPATKRPDGWRSVVSAAAPVGVPAIMLVATIAFGTREPGAEFIDGIVFAVGALCWLAIRRHRLRPLAVNGTRRLTRLITAGGLLAVAAAAAVAVAPALPGAAAGDRSVLRDQVVPPFDISDYPSPLVGFRKYTVDATLLNKQTLFTVSGALPAGTTIRIASLDDYDGSVWDATNSQGFRRVGTSIQPVAGTPTVLHVTIAPAYAAAPDLSAWLPEAGDVAGVTFDGPRGDALAGTLRFNIGAADGVVTGRLRAGDSYTIDTVLSTPPLPRDTQPYGQPSLTENAASILGSRVATWSGNATGIGAKLTAIAAYLQKNGAYSDGGKGESEYLPGHSLGRLATFLNRPQMVGDDEQYAAVMALAANSIGIPARVVFGATPEPDGTVRGSDIHAWVEVHIADGVWVPIPTKMFLPTMKPKPNNDPPNATQNVNAAIVPPPNAVHRPTSTTDTDSNESVRPGKQRKDVVTTSIWPQVWAIVVPIVTWGGPPIAVIVLVGLVILGWKRVRRRRRRRQGTPVNRYAAGWRELVDLARDAGVAVPPGRTRQQQAVLLAGLIDPRPTPDRTYGRHRGHASDHAPASGHAPAPSHAFASGRVQHVGNTLPDEFGDTLLRTVPTATTPEQHELSARIQALADAADLVVYGPGDPGAELAADYWTRVEAARRVILRRYGRWHRWRVRLSTRSLRRSNAASGRTTG